MKLKTAALFLSIAIILSSTALWLIYTQMNETAINEPKKIAVRITEFSVARSWENPVGLLLDCRFNLTVENFGANDIDELKLKVRMFLNDSEVEIGNYFYGVEEYGLVALSAGEVQHFDGSMLYSLHVGGSIDTIGGQPVGAKYLAQVLLGAVILDESSVTL